jgi:hypothetical protein
MLAMAPVLAAALQVDAWGRDAAVRLVPAPALTCKPVQSYRWLDALDQPYSEEFRKIYTYDKAEVSVRFPKECSELRLTLAGRKLKPNFAYQAKLVGMSPAHWGEKGDAAANRRLGEVGRWWRRGEMGGNAYVFDETDKDSLEGYLVFGYFVTDAAGKADVSFRVDSSYHVLWKTSQWPPAKEDGRPTLHRVIARAGSYGYDRSFTDGEFELYAETQYGRPPIGAARLPAGKYRCFLLLTEESFHAWGGGDGGDWAAALAAEIEFTITPPARALGASGGVPK